MAKQKVYSGWYRKSFTNGKYHILIKPGKNSLRRFSHRNFNYIVSLCGRHLGHGSIDYKRHPSTQRCLICDRMR
jgi:hypothetical protein